jgi:allantoinase
LTYNRIAELTSRGPAERFGMSNKGDLAVGYDADFCLLDDSVDYEVRAADSFSTQEYTPFEGFRMTARVTDTFLRGEAVFTDGMITGRPRGQYVRRSGAPS